MPRPKRLTTALLTSFALAAAPAYAHHAMEYLETESTTTAAQGESLVYLRYDYRVDDKNNPSRDRWEITPGLAHGITDRLLADVHVHLAKFGDGHLEDDRQGEFGADGPSPFLEAAAFTLVYRVTDGAWLDVGVAGTLEVPFSRAKDLLGSKEVVAGTLILSRELPGHRNITANLTYEHEGSEGAWEYALAFKTPISADPHGIAAGIELLGDLEDIDRSWSVLPGVYIPIGSPQTILKAGVELSKNLESTRAAVMLMHRF